MSEVLAPKTEAPDFCLSATPDQTVFLHEFVGRPTVLIFYPADWSPVCGDQLALYNEILPEFKKYDATVLGISVDSVWSHLAFSRDRHLRFPLLSDFEPKGEVARHYGAYEQKMGVAARALFVLTDEGIVHWSYKSPIGINPGADGILQALESLPKNTRPKKLKAIRERPKHAKITSTGPANK